MVSCVSALIVVTTLGRSASALSLAQSHTKKAASLQPECVVWHSQHKSGGNSIEMALALYPLRASGLEAGEWHKKQECLLACDVETMPCTEEQCAQAPDLAKESSKCPARVAMKGYVPVLAGSSAWGSPRDGKCLWATMSRSPVSRLVSAYFYCRNGHDHDPLCGQERLDFTKATLHDFAEHWGNYLFRELLWFPELNAIATSRPDYNRSASLDELCSAAGNLMWLTLKDRLNGGDTLQTESGVKNFKAVKDALRSNQLYDVYGVFEQWNETMHIFDQKFDIGMGWLEATNIVYRSHGSETYKQEEDKALQEARKDPFVLKAIAADIELYEEVIVPMFTRELKLAI